MHGSHIEGWMTEPELEWLYRQAKRFRSVVEIGSWKGRSTYALCESGCPLVIAIDHFLGSDEQQAEPAIAEGTLRAEFQRNLAGFNNLRLMSMSSEQAAHILTGVVDMVFIDGSHKYKDVSNDIKLWWPRTTYLIAGHDFDQPDVARAVRQQFPSGYSNIKRGPDSIWSLELI